MLKEKVRILNIRNKFGVTMDVLLDKQQKQIYFSNNELKMGNCICEHWYHMVPSGSFPSSEPWSASSGFPSSFVVPEDFRLLLPEEAGRGGGTAVARNGGAKCVEGVVGADRGSHLWFRNVLPEPNVPSPNGIYKFLPLPR
jgi:hypothetical protein